MRQGIFVRQNEKKWKTFEEKIERMAEIRADELTKMYVHLTEDLAFARAKYPSSHLQEYLSGLVLQLHAQIYKNKPIKSNRFIRFWTAEFPLELRNAYPQIGYAFAIMMVGAFIGWISSAYDDTFSRMILGDAYVDMTLDNIEEGDPMAVYSTMSEGWMFSMITTNNIKVAFIAFIAGVLFSIGTGFILLQNGVMLGTFHYLFFSNGIFDETILTIWIHGTIEISAIIIAGGAGLVMGKGLLFPGTYPRLYAFQKGAKSGLKIVIGLIPFFVVAGFFESFLTRHTEWPLPIKLVIILISFALMVTYLFILPNLNTHAKSEN